MNNKALSVKVTSTSDYCGGAAPSPKVLEQLKQPKSFANQTLFIFDKQDKSGEKFIVRTDATGTFTVNLTNGDYYVFLDEKLNGNKYPNKNKRCTAWLSTPYTSFSVTDDTSGSMDIRIHKDCNPCLPPRR